MAIKKASLFSASLIGLLFVFGSFSTLLAGLAQQEFRPFTRQVAPGDLKVGGSQNVSYEDLSWINQKFHDFANALFRYDERIKDAQDRLLLLQQCLADFAVRATSCIGLADLTDKQLQEKIDVLEIKIAELTANKNKIVTMQDALKKYWYALIPIIAAGGYVAYKYLQDEDLEGKDKNLEKNKVYRSGVENSVGAQEKELTEEEKAEIARKEAERQKQEAKVLTEEVNKEQLTDGGQLSVPASTDNGRVISSVLLEPEYITEARRDLENKTILKQDAQERLKNQRGVIRSLSEQANNEKDQKALAKLRSEIKTEDWRLRRLEEDRMDAMFAEIKAKQELENLLMIRSMYLGVKV